VQDPNIFAGWHHQWSPGSHTLILLSSLRDDFRSQEPFGRISGIVTDHNGTATNTVGDLFPNQMADAWDLDYENDFRAYGGELQQIWRNPSHTFIGGLRGQQGSVDTQTALASKGRGTTWLLYATEATENSELTRQVNQDAEAHLQRWTAYGYWQWQPGESLEIIAGATVDRINFPRNSVFPPISSDEDSKTRLSPKAGFVWTPNDRSRVRGAYSRSLGGLFYDSSVRLEPVQVAGFAQVFRNLAPESVAGLVPGTEFEAADLGSEHRLTSNTYFGWQAEWLESRGDRFIGVFAGPHDFFTLLPTQSEQQIRFTERSLSAYVNQLVGEEWSLGVRYRLYDSDFEIETRGISDAVWQDGAADAEALLHQLNLYAIYNHRSGWFARVDGLWTAQENQAGDARLGDEDFWQFNCGAGYRWPRRRAEVSAGLLNITDKDYRLNPVSLYSRLPRKRTLFASLRLNF
jgi:outer membrane receptor protein involved in Fe transport